MTVNKYLFMKPCPGTLIHFICCHVASCESWSGTSSLPKCCNVRNVVSRVLYKPNPCISSQWDDALQGVFLHPVSPAWGDISKTGNKGGPGFNNTYKRWMKLLCIKKVYFLEKCIIVAFFKATISIRFCLVKSKQVHFLWVSPHWKMCCRLAV